MRVQTVRWAAEPTLESRAFGGHETDRDLDPEDALTLKKQAPIEWARSPTGDRLSPKMGALRGLIGAQSVFSGGEHTIHQLCAGAREAGLDFLGFTEKLEMLTESEWEEVKARCRKASDDRFLAMPGIAARDKVGNRWFGCGYVPYLQPTAVSSDGKILDNTYSCYFKYFRTRFPLPHRPASDYQKVRSFLGFTGSYPGLADVEGGELRNTPVMATIQTTPESEVRFRTVKNADDPIGLTVRIRGFHPGWQVAYLQDDSTTWRYFGQLEGYFYANFYTRVAGHRIVAGHPITCDRPELRIALDDPQGMQRAFEIYNPTGEPIQTRLRLNPTFFRQLRPLPDSSIPVEVGPLTSVLWQLDLDDE